MQSAFSPEAFLDASISTPTEKRKPLPIENPADPAGLYSARIIEVKMRPWEGKKDPTKSGVAADIPLEIQVPLQLQQEMKLPEVVKLTDSFFLDLTEDGKGLDNAPGKNRGLRIYREALDLNKPGDTFSFRKMFGQMIKVKIVHEPYEGDIYDKVGGVFKF